jgi:hypothetical protein
MKFKKLKNISPSKKILSTVLALGIIASVGYFGTNVLADNNNPVHDTIVSRIAEKFNLNEQDVEAVFDSVVQERQDEMKSKREESFSKAVSDGVITEDQKNAIIAKMDENFGERFQNREEMQQWYKDQGIDQTKIAPYLNFGRGERGGHREIGMMR